MALRLSVFKVKLVLSFQTKLTNVSSIKGEMGDEEQYKYQCSCEACLLYLCNKHAWYEDSLRTLKDRL